MPTSEVVNLSAADRALYARPEVQALRARIGAELTPAKLVALSFVAPLLPPRVRRALDELRAAYDEWTSLEASL